MLAWALLTTLAAADDGGTTFLGANPAKGALALRVALWPEETDDPDAPEIEVVDCGYAGHEGFGGVALQLYQADERRKTWVIYDWASKPEDCTPHDTSVARLAEAKAAIAAAGIDLSAESNVVEAADDKLVLPRPSGPPLVLSWERVDDDPRILEVNRRHALEHDEAGDVGGTSHSATRYRLDGTPWRTVYSITSRWPSFYGSEVQAGALAGDQLLLYWEDSSGGMRSATTSSYRTQLLTVPSPVEHTYTNRYRHDLPSAVVRDVVVQDLRVDRPEGSVASVKLVYHHGEATKDCGYAGMKDPRDGVLMTVWSFADGSMELGHEVYPPVRGERHCASAERAADVLAEAKADAADYGLDPTRGAPVRHPLREVWTVGERKVALGGRSVLVDGDEVGTLPEGARVHSAWSHEGHLVFVLLNRAGDVASLSKLFPVGA